MGRRKTGRPISGWVVLDKEVGPTSTQMVSQIRRFFNARKAGHAGTLDPLASGILPIALGEATKTVPFIADAKKKYRFTVRWGRSTTTLDREGDIIGTSAVRPSEPEILRALEGFKGAIAQVPPAFSAVKINGERAYDIARSGKKVELSEREVYVEDVSLRRLLNDDESEFDLICGKGFYIRSFARDLAKKLGTIGYVTNLRRLYVGPFGEASAVSQHKLEEIGVVDAQLEHLMPIHLALDGIPAVEVGAHDVSDLRLGRAVRLLPRVVSELRSKQDGNENSDDQGRRRGQPVLAMFAGRSVALGQVVAGQFRPNRVFQPDTAE